MSSLIRMAYGRSGSRLERILVSAPLPEPAATPLWLKVLLLGAWVVIPVLVSRYTITTATEQKTVIDVSRLTVPAPIATRNPVIPQPQRIPPTRRHFLPPAKPVMPPVQAGKEYLERPAVVPQPAEETPPAITRPSGPGLPAVPQYQPRISRERLPSGTETGSPAAPRIRRETAAGEHPSPQTTIARPRGATATAAPAGRERVEVFLRQAPTEGESRETGEIKRPGTRKGLPAGFLEAQAGGVANIAPARERGHARGTAEGEGPASTGLVRGVSLMSLDICSSPQVEEDAIKAVLNVIGSEKSCANEKGDFQFTGTQRISSFNLIIFPAKGRKPSNRCEELKYAYRCLTVR